jgi:hypothetical protein
MRIQNYFDTSYIETNQITHIKIIIIINKNKILKNNILEHNYKNVNIIS